MKKLIFAVFMLPFVAFAQPDVIAAGGGSGQVANAQISYTIGQTITATGQGSNAIITQGFQQSSYQITEQENINFDLNVSLAPNPTSGDLYVIFSNNINNEEINADIINLKGQVIKSVRITSSRQKLDINKFNSGTYFIKISHNQKYKTFKVIKY